MPTQALNLAGKRTLVIGLGRSGLSMVKSLDALGADVTVMDSRPQPPGLAELRVAYPDVPCHLGGFEQAQCLAADLLLLSPGVSQHHPAIHAAVVAGVPLWGDIELFARQVQAPVAAITGSNGKSTVTTLLGDMAHRDGRQVAVGGNLGPPALELLQQPGVELYVLELSSFQLETTHSLQPQVATVLNLSADHLDRYQGMEDYQAAKQRIFRGAAWQVLNLDDLRVKAMGVSGIPSRGFSLGVPTSAQDFGVLHIKGEEYLAQGDEPWLATRHLQVIGNHNIANALAALSMGDILGLSREAMVDALTSFTGLPHRGQLVAEGHGVRWINDSKATNVGATVAALQGMPEPVVLIAGGQGKGQDFSPLTEVLKHHTRGVVLLGEDAAQLADVMPAGLPVQRAASMVEAVELAAHMAQPGECVLLSPACASFDMFNNFEERGAVFSAAARRLVQC